MSRQLKIKPKGLVYLNKHLLTGPFQFDQQEVKSPDVDLKDGASCELHRVPDAGDPWPNDTLCLRLHATGGAFDVIRARTRPMARKHGGEFNDPEMKNSSRKVTVTGNNKKVMYVIKNKGKGERLKLKFEAIG